MTEARANSHPCPRKVSRAVLGYVLFATAFLAVGLYILFISGPAMHAATRERLAQTIAEEDRSFCEQFAAQSGTAGFAACRRELAMVRQRQAERDNAAALGL
ncbi:hypothetical protein AAFG07_01305 [Bradyrhizobium sp. B097]|uniref:hypothetical protein n=1 Tax=Bradyrhizobium sp. B097 TaxID=3140244 RepID=UPI0031844ACC